MASTKTVTPVVDTAIYASGDTLFDATLVSAPGTADGKLNSITVIDLADQTAAAIELFFFKQDVTFGALNAAPSISDADMAHCIGRVQVPSANFVDVGGAKVASVAVAQSITSPFYVAATVTGTPTYGAATDLKLVCHFD